jgi:hypothetical protein
LDRLQFKEKLQNGGKPVRVLKKKKILALNLLKLKLRRNRHLDLKRLKVKDQRSLKMANQSAVQPLVDRTRK